MDKITPELAVSLGLCYNQTQCEEAAVAGGKSEYTVDELLLGGFIPHDDAMYMVCRTEVTPAKVLRDFAAQVAKNNLATVTSGIPGATPFIKAVDFLQEGDADDRPEELADHAEAVQRFMVSALVIEGPGNWTQPDKIADYKRTLRSAKAIRGALKANPGEAAYAAAHHTYVGTVSAERAEKGKKLRAHLAKIYKAQS